MPTNAGSGAAAVPMVSISEPTRTAMHVPTGMVIGSATNDITYAATNVEVWDAWNQIYSTTSTTFTGAQMNAATVHQIRAHLNAMAHRAHMNGEIWTAWNITYATNTITLTATNGTLATVNTAGTNTITIADNTWSAWMHSYQERADHAERAGRQAAAGAQPTEAQRERWRQEEIRRNEERTKLLKEEIVAKEKAIVLLKSCLSHQQLEEYEKKKHFHLHVGDKVYRIEQGSHGNVKLVDKDGKVKRSFCIQPRGVPEGDAMLAQKLLLQTDEKGFYESANVTEYGQDGRTLGTFSGARAVDLLRRDQQPTG